MMGYVTYPKRALGLVLAATALAANPAVADTSTMGAETNVIVPASLTLSQPLDFGQIIPSRLAGRVTINARNGARTGNANVTLVGTDFSRVIIVATGAPNAAVTIRSSRTSVTLSGPSGATMILNTLRISRNNVGQLTLPRNYTIPATGTMNLGIGGRLNVRANQAPGVYSGSFDITMDYQ
jgi:hypothetical protein